LSVVLSKRSVLLCVVCGQKDSIRRVFIKKCFLFAVGTVRLLKRFTVESSNVANDSLTIKKVAEKTVERLLHVNCGC
jgi:hypothetical protein